MKQQREFMLMKALTYKYAGHNSSADIADYMDRTGQGEELEKQFPTKNVCAKLQVSLVENMESVCSVLGISKRAFIENAIIAAIGEFNEIAQDHEIFEAHELIEESK